MHGDGQSLWVTCHVDDVKRAFVAAIGNERAYGKAYHTAGDNWMTWNQFHAGVAEALGVPLPRLVHIPTDVLAAVAPERAGISIFNFSVRHDLSTTAPRGPTWALSRRLAGWKACAHGGLARRQSAHRGQRPGHLRGSLD